MKKIENFSQLGDALKKLFKNEFVVMFAKHDCKKHIGYQMYSRPSNKNLKFNIEFEVVKKGCKNTNRDRFFIYRLAIKEKREPDTNGEYCLGYEIHKESKDPQVIFDFIKTIKETENEDI